MRKKTSLKGKEKRRDISITLKTIRCLFKIAWQHKPSMFIIYAINIIVVAVKPFINIVFTKLIIDELLGGKSIERIVLYVAITIGGNALVNIIESLLGELRGINADSMEKLMARLISQKALSMDFQHTEDKQVLDQLEKAKTGTLWYSGGIDGIMGIVSVIIQNVLIILGAGILIIIRFPILLIVLVVSLIIRTILQSKNNAFEIKFFKRLSHNNRAFGYYFWELDDFKYGKDVRLYSADSVVIEKADSHICNMTGWWHEIAKKSSNYNAASGIADSIRDGLVYLVLGLNALRKIISIGDFSMYLIATNTLNTSMGNITTSVMDIMRRCHYAYEFVKFMEYPSAMENGDKTLQVKEKHTIEFRNVSFRYPRTDDYVLKDFSLKINSGERLSVVGLNGTGKTTFIKLLCRLYDVTAGEILLDGTNIKEYDTNEYRKMFSVVFQDFKLLAFTVKENIALVNSDNAPDEEVMELLKLTGMSDTIASLDKGLNTPAFKAYDESGTEFSGGEQQKLAIARALYKNSPVVILDEPTAALDPVAEHEIYRHFDTLIGGKTAIYISHRLSSCKFSDRIAVFSDGGIAEYGTHDELVRYKDGIYAEMFTAQAQYYV